MLTLTAQETPGLLFRSERMAQNTNLQAITVANQQIRPLADAIVHFYWLAKQAKTASIAQSWNSTLFAVDADVVADGAAADGRTLVTNNQLKIVLANADALVASLEASANLTLNQVVQVSVATK